jgi:hypothetical protein
MRIGSFTSVKKAEYGVDHAPKSSAEVKERFQITANRMQRFLVYLFFTDALHVSAVPPPIIRST